ncbi:MAG: 3'-5' exonuclease [Phycisphaerae bacterium]
MYLFFDTETTGIPRNYKAPVTDLNNWPRVVQLAFLLTDGAGQPLASWQAIIKPDGYTIPPDAANIHGITTARALSEGVAIATALQEFLTRLADCQVLVAHNISFDENILGAEFLRAKLANPLPAKKRVCTMLSTTEFCAIPGPYGFKWPRLEQLYRKLFNETFADAHSALGDVTACARCFFELKKIGVIR